MNNIRIEKNGDSVVLKADMDKMSAREREDLLRMVGLDPEKKRSDYQKKNIKNHVVMVSVSINRITEPDIAEFIESIDNKSAYMKSLIRAEMKRSKANEM